MAWNRTLKEQLSRFSYDLSKLKMEELTLQSIDEYKFEYKPRVVNDFAGWYLITDTLTGMNYVGKSRSLILRLKKHIGLARRNSGCFVDIKMHGRLEHFKFFVLGRYSDVGLTLENKVFEKIIEKDLINKWGSNFPTGYNQNKP